MNRPSPGLRPPSPRLAGRGQGEGCQSGSWPRFTSEFWRCPLPMNRPLTPSLSPSEGERVPEGRVRGGSWSQCMRNKERGLSMNRLSECGQPCPNESSPRHSRTRLSALLSVAGSWSRCVILKSWRLPMNLVGRAVNSVLWKPRLIFRTPRSAKAAEPSTPGR